MASLVQFFGFCTPEISHQSHLCTSGNTFYLVMPTVQGESITDDPVDPPTPTATQFPLPPEEMMAVEHRPEEIPACLAQPDQSEPLQLKQEEDSGLLQAGQQCHVIKNVDEIFHTIEGLMSKLHKLKVSFCSAATERHPRCCFFSALFKLRV